LKEVEARTRAKDICREYGISEGRYYKLQAKYGGMEASDGKKRKTLEEENRRLPSPKHRKPLLEVTAGRDPARGEKHLRRRTMALLTG